MSAFNAGSNKSVTLKLDEPKPVKITLPIPSGVSKQNLVIVHKHSDGTTEEIEPTIEGDKVTFVLTSFSDFM